MLLEAYRKLWESEGIEGRKSILRVVNRLVSRFGLVWVDTPGSLVRFKSVAGELDNILNKSKIIKDEKEHRVTWLVEQPWNDPVRYMRNYFAIDALTVIGGGANHQLVNGFRHQRAGGSTIDLYNYMVSYVNVANGVFQYTASNNDLLNWFFGVKTSSQALLPFDKIYDKLSIKYQTSPGVLKKSMGYKSKIESSIVEMTVARFIYTNWCITPNSQVKPHELWSVAARPKLIDVKKKLPAIRMGASTSRAISVCSLLETILSYPLYYAIEALMKKAFKIRFSHVAIGVRRHSVEWVELSKHFNGAKFIMVGDYKKYDTSLPAHLLERGFNMIASAFNTEDEFTNNYVNNWIDWVDKNLIKKEYLLGKQAKIKIEGGLPSGSLWTSILNSVCNGIMIFEFLKTRNKSNRYTPFIYGDDFVIISYDDTDGKKFKRDYSKFTWKNFGVRLQEEETYISSPGEFFVTYERPVYEPGEYLSGGTSALRSVKTEYANEPFTEYDYNKGTTHRWKYVFKKRARFLQYYWMQSGVSIRPLRETLNRIINPEYSIRTVRECEALYVAHLVDNFNNAHVRNWIFHLMYDLEFESKYYSYKRGEVPTAFRISCNSKMYENWKKDEAIKGTRGWYRKIDEYVDLTKEACMERFNQKWQRIIESVSSVFSCEFGIEHYELKDHLLHLLRSGYGAWSDKYQSGSAYLVKGGLVYPDDWNPVPLMSLKQRLHRNLERCRGIGFYEKEPLGVLAFAASFMPIDSQVDLIMMQTSFDNKYRFSEREIANYRSPIRLARMIASCLQVMMEAGTACHQYHLFKSYLKGD